jgi:hypothetical protein
MKKISLLIVVLILITTTISIGSVYAAPDSGTPYFSFEYQALNIGDKDYLEATAYFNANGSEEILSGAELDIKYNIETVIPVNAESKERITVNTTSGASHITDLTKDHNQLKSWSISPTVIAVITNSTYSATCLRFGWGDLTPSAPYPNRPVLTGEEKIALFKVYFEKIGNVSEEVFSLYNKATNPGKAQSSITVLSNEVSKRYVDANATGSDVTVGDFLFVKDVTPKDEPEVPGVDNGDSNLEDGEGTTPKAITVSGRANNFQLIEGDDVEVGAMLFQGDFAAPDYVRYFPAYDVTDGEKWEKPEPNIEDEQEAKIALWGKKNGQFAITLDGIKDSLLPAGEYKIAAYERIGDAYKMVLGTDVTFTKEAKEEDGD